MEIKEIIGQKFERTAVFERSSIDQKKRTVALSFSSEEPYERYWGVEILDHGPGAVVLDRLKDAAPLLVNHDTRDQVGVIEQAIVGADRRGRAIVRFGRGPSGPRKSFRMWSTASGRRCQSVTGFTKWFWK